MSFSVLKHRVLIDVQLHIFLHMPMASASKHSCGGLIGRSLNTKLT